MPIDISLLFRLAAFSIFLVTLYAGYYMLKNYQRLFGVDPDLPGEGQSARAYFKVQIFAIWAHVLLGSGAAAILLG